MLVLKVLRRQELEAPVLEVLQETRDLEVLPETQGTSEPHGAQEQGTQESQERTSQRQQETREQRTL